VYVRVIFGEFNVYRDNYVYTYVYTARGILLSSTRQKFSKSTRDVLFLSLGRKYICVYLLKDYL